MKSLLALLLLTYSCTSAQQNYRELKNIETFARLYGYVRYFHPSDEAASINWDRFAIYGVDAVIRVKSDEELVATLNRLFQPVAPSVLIGASPQYQKKTITPDNVSGYKPVFWFHTGVGLSENSIYSSVRLNRPKPGMKSKQQNAFAPITQAIDAEKYRGKEIKLKGRMKVDAREDGSGHFWLRVDKSKGVGFFYNMGDKPAMENEWREYEFEGKVDDDANKIVFGCFIKGEGAVWVDSISLFERKNSKEAWTPIVIENGQFNEIKDGKPEGWFAGPVAGYKYAVSPIDNSNILEIASTASEKSAAEIVTTISYKHTPQAGDIIEKQLSSGIKAIVPIVLYGTADHTYPVADANALADLKTKIADFTKEHRTADSLAVRLGDVTIAWNIFRHFFPYWEDASSTPEKILTAALKKSFTDHTPLEFKETLLQMTVPLNDGHVWINLEGDMSNAYQLPLQLDWVENKIVVDAVLDSTITDVKRGDIIETMNGRNAVDVYKEKMSLVSGSPQWKSNRAIAGLASGALNTSVQLSLLRNGKRIESNLARTVTPQQFYGFSKSLKKHSGKITDDIFYLDLSTISRDTIDKWANDLADAKGIICDLRGYPTGNHNLINYLLKKTEDTKWMFVPETAYPDQQQIQLRESGWNMKPQKPHIQGKVIFITDGRAISYAESYMGFIKDFKLATIIGQPTAGTNGNVNPFTLPGGYRISWTGMLVKNHDGSKHHLKGIVPDIYLKRTIKAVSEGRDEFYEKALELVKAAD